MRSTWEAVLEICHESSPRGSFSGLRLFLLFAGIFSPETLVLFWSELEMDLGHTYRLRTVDLKGIYRRVEFIFKVKILLNCYIYSPGPLYHTGIPQILR